MESYSKAAFALPNINTPVTNVNSPRLNKMKNLLNTGHVLVIGTDFGGDWTYNSTIGRFMFSDWEYASLSNGEIVCIGQNDTNNNFDGHAMAIVGYDDSIWYDYNGNDIQEDYEMGAFKLVNSHGTSYGNDGFIWVMYDALNKVSNYSGQNKSTRKSIFEDYAYYYIEVAASAMDLTATINLAHLTRNHFVLNLAIPYYSTQNYPTVYANTMLHNNGGAYRLGGTAAYSYSGSLVFDYDALVSGERPRMKYFVEISDTVAGSLGIVSSITITDRTGKTVLVDNINEGIDHDTLLMSYRIGMMGDVDDSGSIDIFDASSIQSQLSGDLTLSDEDLIVADVDGDDDITVFDVTEIQRYLSHYITEFDNGAFAYLE